MVTLDNDGQRDPNCVCHARQVALSSEMWEGQTQLYADYSKLIYNKYSKGLNHSTDMYYKLQTIFFTSKDFFIRLTIMIVLTKP